MNSRFSIFFVINNQLLLKFYFLFYCFCLLLGCNGDNASTASVSDNPSPEIYISSTSSLVPVNSSVTVSWVSKNVSSCIASGDWEGVRPTSGLESFIIESAKTYNFNLNCSRLNTSHFAKVTINGYQAWNFTQRGFDLNGQASNDQSGLSLSLDSDGDILAIWSKNIGGNGNNSGHTRIYAWNGITWVQRGKDIDGEAEGDNSGYSLSLSSDGNIIGIGAPFNDDNGNNAGHTRIYVWNGDTWMQRGNDIDGETEGDGSGKSLSINGDGSIIAIGAYANDDNGNNAGHTRIYAWNGDTWMQRGNDIDGENAGDFSGLSVSLSKDGTVVAIGAYANDDNGNNAGHTRIYAWNGDTWMQRGNDIDGEAEGDYSGESVSINADGTIVAIGASGNDSSGSNAGHAQIYEWDGGAWTQRGEDIDGQNAEDFSGESISLNSDSKLTIVAIGAYGNDSNGSDAGQVRTFVWQ